MATRIAEAVIFKTRVCALLYTQENDRPLNVLNMLVLRCTDGSAWSSTAVVRPAVPSGTPGRDPSATCRFELLVSDLVHSDCWPTRCGSQSELPDHVAHTIQIRSDSVQIAYQ